MVPVNWPVLDTISSSASSARIKTASVPSSVVAARSTSEPAAAENWYSTAVEPNVPWAGTPGSSSAGASQSIAVGSSCTASSTSCPAVVSVSW